MQKWLSVKFLIAVVCLFIIAPPALAEGDNRVASVSTSQLISQQTILLKNRLDEAKSQFEFLQRQNDTVIAKPSTQLRNQAALDGAVAKSNVDSINIELAESQQAINRLEKGIQEVENQLNVFSVFGIKIAPTAALNIDGLRAELSYQQNLLGLEKNRAVYLYELKKIADSSWQLQKLRYVRINTQLQSRSLLLLKQRQEQSEANFEQQQSYWLLQLNNFYKQLNIVETAKVKNKPAYENLQREIFYANENLNFSYLQMLIVRYQDQLQQFKIAISHNTSITLLNKTSDELTQLTKQLKRVNELLNDRVENLARHKTFLKMEIVGEMNEPADTDTLLQLSNQYQTAKKNLDDLGADALAFRGELDKSLQLELSSRQGLPGLSAKAWLNLGAELWMVPALTFQMLKSLTFAVATALKGLSLMAIILISCLEIGLITIFLFANNILAKIISGMAEHELGHINLKRLCIKVLRRNLLDIFVIGNLLVLFYLSNIPLQTAAFLVNLAMIWLFFKIITTMARVCFVETVHDQAGRDVMLYHRLKWSFVVGGMITALTVLIQQLPVIYEVKDLFDRLFLAFLLVVSIFLLRSWEVLPNLIVPHIDDGRLYLKKIVRLFGMLIPLILLFNTAIGIFGFVNLVLTVSWYESIFILIMVGYLVVRGLLIDGMVSVSNLVIRHVMNGWLWTEAILKPLDKVLRITLFFAAWALLFELYGWNQQSTVVIQLNNILHYHIGEIFNTSITPLSMLEAGVIVSVVFWAARWTREFIYRLLATHTPDMGLRNSMAIFSQYTVIIVGVFICLRVVGIDFRALAVVAGAFAFGVGLGLRDLFNNFACGFLLLIERPIRVGDYVTVDTYEGEVMHIGARAVTIRTWDHMDVLVPNAEIFSKSFTNWTGKDHVIRTVVMLKINRHDNPQDVQAVIYRVLANNKDVLSDPVAEVFMKEVSDSLIEFEVRYFLNLRQVKSRVALRSEILFGICEAFEKHGIQPPYPHHEVHVKGSLVSQSFDRPLMPAPAMMMKD